MEYGDFILTSREPGSHSLEIYNKKSDYTGLYIQHLTEQQASNFVLYVGHDPKEVLPELKRRYLANK